MYRLRRVAKYLCRGNNIYCFVSKSLVEVHKPVNTETDVVELIIKNRIWFASLLNNSYSYYIVEMVMDIYHVFDVVWFRDKLAEYVVKHNYIVQFLARHVNLTSLNHSMLLYPSMYEKVDNMEITHKQIRASSLLMDYVIANNRNRNTYLNCKCIVANYEAEYLSIEFRNWYMLDLLKEDHYIQLFRLLRIPTFKPELSHGTCLDWYKRYHSNCTKYSGNIIVDLIVHASVAYKNKDRSELNRLHKNANGINMLPIVIRRTIRKMITILDGQECRRFHEAGRK